ncbi:class I SAM-dependent DNA methyltransferase [Elusimicrobiota bacterium]
MQSNYQFLSSVYDEVMGHNYLETYKDLIKKSIGKSTRKSILDLGCGTGTLLSSLSGKNKTFGIDISPQMIKIAKAKDKKTRYRVMNIQNFRLGRSFDIITCAFDTINHITSFKGWQDIFKSVHKHLAENGIFIFDVNTPEGFAGINNKILTKTLPFGYVAMETKSKKNFCTWRIKIVTRGNQCIYKVHEETIQEAAFPLKRITAELEKYFKVTHAPTRMPARRIFFTCKKRVNAGC